MSQNSGSSHSSHSFDEPTVDDTYPEEMRSGSLAEHIDNIDFLNNPAKAVAGDVMSWFIDALDSYPVFHTACGADYGTALYENACSGSVHMALFDHHPDIVFNAFPNRQAAFAAMQEFNTCHADADKTCTFLRRIVHPIHTSDTPEWLPVWKDFLQRHQAGMYNPGYKAVTMSVFFG